MLDSNYGESYWYDTMVVSGHNTPSDLTNSKNDIFNQLLEPAPTHCENDKKPLKNSKKVFFFFSYILVSNDTTHIDTHTQTDEQTNKKKNSAE